VALEKLSHILDLVETPEFARACQTLRRLGVYRLKASELEVEISLLEAPEAPASEPDLAQPTVYTVKDPLSHPATDDELLFWSVGGSGIEGVPPEFSEDIE
jgi:hypothetical protein